MSVMFNFTNIPSLNKTLCGSMSKVFYLKNGFINQKYINVQFAAQQTFSEIKNDADLKREMAKRDLFFDEREMGFVK